MFETPFMNAAGTVKLVEQLERLQGTPTGARVVGSYTVEPRTGNEGTTYASERPWAINALGLPNPGIDYLADNIDRMRQMAGDGPLIVSIAGFTAREYARLAEAVQSYEGVWIEINLGCPNVWADGAQKSIASFDASYSADVHDAVREAVPTTKVGVKLSPYSNPATIPHVVEALERWRVPSFYTICNTFPNAWMPDWIDPLYGGLSGPAMKPIVLGQVKQVRQVTDSPIIASGGVTRGRDWPDYEAAGACAVQVGSAFLDAGERPQLFVDMIEDWRDG